MNREIKFRAWDKNNKKMHYQPEVNFHFFDDEFTCVLNEHDQVVVQPESVVVMQFTGLKDKQNKEIYEGDIIKITTKNHDEIYFDEIYWSVADAMFCLKKFSRNIFTMQPHNVEIVGNIYENPELLTKKG